MEEIRRGVGREGRRKEEGRKKGRSLQRSSERHTTYSLQYSQDIQSNWGLEAQWGSRGNAAMLCCVCFLISFINQMYLDATKLCYNTSVMQTKHEAPEIFLVALPNALITLSTVEHLTCSHKV